MPRDWQQILSKKHVQEPEVSVTSQLQLVNINPLVLETVETVKPHLLRSKNWSEREEARLVGELRKGLGRQLVDREILSTNLKERAKNGEDQVTGGQVELSLRAQGLRLDRGVLNR